MDLEQLLQNGNRVRHYTAVRQHDKAIALAGEMVAAYPDNAGARQALIAALRGKKLDKEALEQARELLAIDAENVLAWHWIAILSPKPKESRAAIERAIELQPQNANLYACKAWVLSRQLRKQVWISTSEIEKALRIALELNPRHREANLRLSSFLATSPGRMAEARQHCEFVLQNNPNDAEALRQLAQLEVIAKHHSKAHTALTQSLQIDPHNKWAQAQLRIERANSRHEARRSRNHQFLSAIYKRYFGGWPAYLVVPFFIGVSAALIAGFFLFLWSFSNPLFEVRPWAWFDVFSIPLALVCLFLTQFAFEPVLKNVPRKRLPTELQHLGK